ncbi:outer membrane beta-barrel protein [Oceanobacter mangrovi]|uniref:outer membrane beta-barrel protein n=1 Tax=Oceanobacter mangrovi TaxID=2862510 RepID=UPI001C8E6B3D|nr:outer membrane beta-barrel protein [Oceanobacter mangrovi]
MKSRITQAVLITTLASASTLALAETNMSGGDDLAKKLYLGGGLSYNTVDSPFGGGSIDATGVQGLVGLDLGHHSGGISTKLEVGYSQTDDFDNTNQNISGLWGALVAEKSLPEIDRNLSLLGRVGVDVGDDDGILTGVGVGYQLTNELQLRGEFINKDASNQYMGSLIFHL